MEKQQQDTRGRIYSPDQYGTSFEPQAQAVPYEPVRAYDPSEQIKQQSAAQVEQVQVLARAANRQLELDNRLLSMGKEVAGYNATLAQGQAALNSKALQSLLSLSQTAVNTWQEVSKVQERVQQENLLLDEAFNITPQQQQQDQQQNAAVTADAAGTAVVADELRQKGDIESKSLAHQLQESTIFKQLQGQQLNAASAVTNYRPFLLEAVNQLPPELKPRGTAESYALLRELQRQYFSMTGLLTADRQTKLKYAPSILNANAEISYQLVNTAIKTAQADNKLESQSFIYNLFSSKAYTDQELWNKASERVKLLDHGFSSQRDADAWVLKTVLGRLALEPDGLARVQDFESVLRFNQAGTELSNNFASEFAAAKELAKTETEKLRRQQLIALNQQLYKELNGIENPEQRRDIIARHQDIFAKAGFYQEAYDLSQKAFDLGSPESAAYAKAQVYEAIQNKEITTKEELERMRPLMKVEDYNTAVSMLEKEETKRENDVKSTVAAGTAAFNTLLETKSGWKKDPNGNFIPGVNSAYISLDNIKRIEASYKADLEQYLLVVRQQNPDLKGPQLVQTLQQAEKDFFTTNVSAAAGKYYIPNTTGNLSDSNNKQALDRFKQMPQKLTYSADVEKWTGSRDWTRFTGGGAPIGSTIRGQFKLNRGDKIFTEDQVAILSEAWDRGEVQRILSKRADELNVTPLALLNSQLRAYGQDSKLPAIPAGNGGPLPANGNFTNATQVASYLVTRHQLSNKAAAYITGSLQQENGSFNGQRAPWDDLGAKAGGLASWRAGRLDAIEKRFGRPITRISDAEQLDYMVEDMRQNYKASWRVLTTPNSTPRQLEKAIYGYWVYGAEGERFNYAQRILKQLENTSRSSGLSQPATKRTISVGRTLLNLGVSGIWQHPNFNIDSGFNPKGGQRVAPAGVSGRSATSYHASNQALDIALSHNTPQQLAKAWNYLVSNQAQLGIAELFWNKKGFFRDGKSIGKPGSNAIPDHDDHIHVAFK